jgi:type I restriction enzyme S subunit
MARTVTKIKPYARYAESGSPWLGVVPQHWDVRKLRTLIEARNERNRPDLPLLSVAREKGVFVRPPKGDDNNHNVIPDDLSNYKVARAGDLVINKMKAWQGSMGVAPCDGVVSPAYFVFDLKISNHTFAERLLRSRPYVAHFGQASDGVRIGQWDLSIQGMRQIPVAIPTEAEQAAIVRFLDYANGRLARTTRANQKVLALLNEQKQAIINRAITRGADPAATLKPSGVPWLGEIPAHWQVSRLKFEATDIVDCLHATPHYTPEGQFPAIRTADIEPGKVRLAQARKVTRKQFDLWTSRLKPMTGDILYSREGERFGIAALVPKDVELCISQRMMVFRIRPAQCSEFIMWQLNTKHVYAQASCDIIGSTAPHVNVERIKNYRLAIPPRSEQEQICAQIRSECASLDEAIQRSEREITLLREYRTRLIADVVTGKLDVREVAQHLPDETEGPEPAAVSEDSAEEESRELATSERADV